MPIPRYEIPSNVLAALQEASGGSFVLFILDEDGMPALYENHDSEGHAALLKNFAADWLTAEREFRKEEMINDLYEESMGDMSSLDGGLDEEN